MSLYQLARDGAIEELTGYLTEGERAIVRARAAELLGESATAADDAVIESLIDAAEDDPAREVRRAAVDALDQLGREPLEALIAELAGIDRTEQADWVAAQEYQRFLSAEQPELRMAAATAIGRVGGREELPSLRERFDDPDTRVRARAVRACGRIGVPGGVPAIAEVLETDDAASVRRDSAHALGAIGHTRALDALVTALDDPNSDVRRAAIAAISELGDPSPMQAVVPLLDDPDEAVRQATAFAIVELLARAPADRSHEIRASIVDQLRTIDLTASLYAPLLDILESGAEARHRRNVVWLLGRIAGEDAPRAVVEALVRTLGDADQSIARFAATSLVEIDGEAVESALLETLSDETLGERPRAMAAFALGKICGEQARRRLETIIDETESETIRERAFAALSKIGPGGGAVGTIGDAPPPNSVEEPVTSE